MVTDPSVYGTHSFRSGGATKAAKSGMGERVFQRHGRWKSVSAKDGYVKDNITSRISVSKSLGFYLRASIFQALSLSSIGLLICCTLVLGQDMQNKPNGSLCVLSCPL